MATPTDSERLDWCCDMLGKINGVILFGEGEDREKTLRKLSIECAEYMAQWAIDDGEVDGAQDWQTLLAIMKEAANV